MADPILRVPDVLALLNVCQATLYAMKARGDFPAPIKITSRAIGWRTSTVESWIAEREAASQAAPKPAIAAE